MFHLGQHLMTLYGRGQLAIDDDSGLLRKFILESVPEIRRRTIGFVGSSLNNDNPLPEEVIERFMRLWELYWEKCGPADVEGEATSSLFGMWFTSRKFPVEWSLIQLEKFVLAAQKVEPDDLIVERLAEIGDNDIARSINVLDHLVRHDEGWGMHTWQKQAMKLLHAGLQSEVVVRQKAVQLIDYLGRRGYVEFGTLLETEVGETD